MGATAILIQYIIVKTYLKTVTKRNLYKNLYVWDLAQPFCIYLRNIEVLVL